MRHGWLVIVTLCMAGAFTLRAAEEKPESVQLEIYDISDLVKALIDWPAPDAVPGVTNSTVVDVFANAPAGPGFRAPDLVTLLHDRVFPGEFADPSTSIAESNSQLVVMQRPKVQNEIRTYLSKLHETVKPQVIIKAMLVATSDAPPAALLDAAAFAKLTAVLPPEDILGAPRLLCYNAQTAHVRSGRIFNYIRDYDVAGAVYDPVVSQGFDGIVFEARAALNAARSSADVNVRFTYNVQTGWETRKIVLAPPVTMEGGDKADGNTVKLPIDVPAFDTQHISTTLRIPLGKWFLAGAMKNPNRDAKEKRVLLFVSVEAGRGAAAK